METVTEFLSKLASKGVKLSAESGRLNCYAQKGMLTHDIQEGILKYKPQIIALLEGRGKKQQTQTDKSAPGKSSEFPLSAGQKGLYILQSLHPEMSAYNVPVCVKINSPIDAGMLAKAWGYVLEQFPILTARVIEKEGELYHRLDDGCKTTIQQRRIDFADDHHLLSFLKQQAKEPFDLNHGPLTRIDLFTRDKQRSVLLLTVHHVVFDGISAMILLKSFLEFYQQLSQGKPVHLSHELLGYQEFVAWEEAMLASAEGTAHASYWQKQLGGELPAIELLPDLPRSVSSAFEGKTFVRDLPEELSRRVRGFSKAHSSPPSVIFLTVFQLLLQRYTSQEDIIVGMPVMGRVVQKFMAEVGYFVNMAPIRTRCEGRLKLSDFLRRVQGTMLDALYHSSYPFPRMLDKLKFKQTRKNPVFQVTYAYQNFIQQADLTTLPQQHGLYIENVPEIVQEGESDLGLEIFEHEASFSLHLKYNPGLYTQDTARRFIGHYCTLLRSITENPSLLLHEYSIVSEEEKEELEEGSRGVRLEYGREKCVHELFMEQAEMYPEKRAVVCGGEELTYEQLRERSGKLAMYLQAEGVRPESLVGVCMERSVEMVVGLLGVLQAGGAYVPLDPGYPEERLGYMLKDSGAGIVLTEGKLKEKLRGLVGEEVKLVAVDGEWEEIEERVAELRANQVELEKQVQPHHLAYVIYTSGSTGQPKGVAIEHHSPVTLIHWASQVYSKEELAGVLASTSICFDLSVYEIFVTLANSGTIFLVPNALGLINLANKESITLINTVPSAMEELIRLGAIADSVQTINLAGELLSPALVDKVYDSSSVKKVYDLYGPSEDTTYSTFALREKNAPQTIGRPIANTEVYILDPHNHLQPIGVPGELHIAGDGLARGYLNRSELTQEKFVANPFQPGTRMYKTGDLARWQEDGNLQYLGRIDTQVKVRGFRIELGEIEARLNQYPEIKDSAVVAQGQGASQQLVAFYRAKGTQADHIVHLPYEVLREHLLRTLPEYMVPAAFVSLAVIPLNPNGKVDRRVLARMDVTIASGRKYVVPRSDTEKQLVAIWAEVLNLTPEKIGVNDNFFELGGHSLSTVQLMAKINRQFKQLLPLAVMFTASNIAALAQLISNKEATSIDILVPIQTKGNAPPIFGVPGAGGNVLSLQPLSRALGTEQPFYGLQAVGLDGRTLPLNSVEETAKANIAALKSLQPAGPYSLIGHSYGGVVAYEMARTLLEHGEEISSLILLDSMAPSVMQRKMANDEVTELFDVCTTIANLHGASVKIDLQRLQRSSGGENVQYIVDLLNDCGVEIDSEQFTAFYGVYRANLLCYRTYTPSMLPLKIDVWLYRATQGHQLGPTMPPDYGWNQLLQGPIRIQDVVANHFSILEKVHIQGLAGAFDLSAAFAASY